MNPTKNDGGPANDRATTSDLTRFANGTASGQVSWWSVYEFITPMLTSQAKPWPMIGTPTWCALDDDDPAKMAAVIDAAQHWALQLETRQEALCDASREISAAADWSALAQRYRTHCEFYAARPWLKRVTS